ncbi:lysophospholipid acyltransferase family protein [Desulfurispira natronophila]|uniref:KDO2-lipid IV(A) lauroyltransferase n=1 Tax=Desulfurispira natronophila TaxID=682562 RepID=A0A7W7Y3S8_9BACT|nr:lysophospholipid acyltransferase family protein [Desulfurispira natronophila]MBB5021499.1 KDO2-lipid IV(A) lauroyltransferase [Desulfurispira natronophila]
MFKARMVEYMLRLLALVPLPVLHAVGSACGWLLYWFPNDFRRITRINVQRCFPELTARQQRLLERQALQETCKTALETGYIWFNSTARLLAKVKSTHGGDLLQKAMSKGKGVIIASPHLGCWEIVGRYLGNRYPITCLYRPSREPDMDYIALLGRKQDQTTLVPTDATGVKQLFATLRQGNMVGILPDQDPRYGSGVFAPFFGIPAKTMTLLPKLAAKTGVPVFFVFAQRLPWGRGYEIHIVAADSNIVSEDNVLAATAMNKGVEACVRQVPQQYQWSYKRFRTRPEGKGNGPRFYPRDRNT